MENQFTLYSFLDRFKIFSRYSVKFLGVAFVGVHIPLLGILFFILFSKNPLSNPWTVFSIVLVFTLIAALATLYSLNKLLKPMLYVKKVLGVYQENRQILELPQHYNDELGLLMKQVGDNIQNFELVLKKNEDLLSMISHDIRNPLGQISTLAHLTDGASVESKNEYAGMIKEISENQLQYLEEILTLLHTEQLGYHPGKLKVVNAKSYLVECIKELQPLAAKKNITLKHDVNQKATFKIKPLIFKKVVQNLVTNAIKFSHENSTVTLKASSSHDNSTLAVIDEGIGFNNELKKVIFSKFSASGREGTHGEKSTGLGLYISKEIVEKHRGTITANSKGKGKGSEFCVSLPN